MHDPFLYLESKRSQISEASEPIKRIVRISGLSNLEELLDDVRNNEFPCVAVDMGADGRLDLTAGSFEVTFNTFYVLISVDASSSQDECYKIMKRAKDIGMAIIKSMIADSHEINSPCYGLNCENIAFSSFGPIGFQCYGYSFNYTLANDNA